jgi:hypothetical protein
MTELNSAENRFSSYGPPTIIFVVANFSMFAFPCLIPSFPDRPSIRKVSETTANQLMRVRDPMWTNALLFIVDGQTHNIEDWSAIGQHFGVIVTQTVAIAQFSSVSVCRPLLIAPCESGEPSQAAAR